jgi:hypothetical protein
MTDQTNKLLASFVESLSTISYNEVLEALNILSVRLFVCAPQNTGMEALEECHRVQKELLLKFLGEKENTSQKLAEGIRGFGELGGESSN